MFGTSGIRGIYGKEINECLAERIAYIFASMQPEGSKFVIGRDIRKSGPGLLAAVTRGAHAAGCDVIDLGVVPTPTVALATKKHSCHGIMITASHNPPEHNGLKLIKDTKEIGKPLEQEITRRYKEQNNNQVNKTSSQKITNEIGNDATLYHDNEIIENHIEMVLCLVNHKAIARKKPKVVVDCNGAAAVISPYMLERLGCEVISVNASLDCFNRPSEPNKENLRHLPALIKSANADFAIAHDGDSDRCVVLDENGEMIPFDVQLAIMIEHELASKQNPKQQNNKTQNNRIIATVEASLAIRDVVKQAGGSIDITPVGSTYVSNLMEENGALFGGEPCGEYVYRDGVHVPDAILAAAKFVEIFATKGRFSAIKAGYTQNPMAREKFPADNKHAAMEKIVAEVSKMHWGSGIKIRDDDGIRVDEEDGWFLIRASGTESIIRLTMEYNNQMRLDERKGQLVALIKQQSTI